MMSKGIKYTIGIIIAGIVIYNSMYFSPLDKKLAEEHKIVFDANLFVNSIWEKELINVYDSATDLTELIAMLNEDPELTFRDQANALGIGNIGYFRVKGEGTVMRVTENNVLLKVAGQIVELETEFIFGNAVRDASGLVKVNDYDLTSDFNSISESINDRIRREVIPNFRAKVEEGNTVSFNGALELNKAHLNLSLPEVIPVSIQIIP